MQPKFQRNFYPNLLSWSELEFLINVRPLMSQDRVKVLVNKNIEFEWDCPVWQLDKNTYPPTLLRHLLNKYVCYFHDMSRATKKINNVCNELEKQYNRQTDAHIYLCRNTKLKKHPFGKHYDQSDNVIIQCEGVTNFKVWDINDKLIFDVDMKNGDAIWIPMHYPHLATSKTKRLSVSFPICDKPIQAEHDRAWVTLD